MKIVSVNTGLPREIRVDGETVRTSIWKAPRQGRVRVSTLNLDGDRQSDRTVHGGPMKAVYCYPSEHYVYWRGQLPDAEMPWGVFGENLTLEGLLETEICIGDRFRAGSAEFLVTQPRQPCFKLGIRFGRGDMIKRFIESGRSGFYVAVVREGAVGSGDSIEVVGRGADSMSVSAIARLRYNDDATDSELRRAAALPGLSDSWRNSFSKRAKERRA